MPNWKFYFWWDGIKIGPFNSPEEIREFHFLNFADCRTYWFADYLGQTVIMYAS